MGMFKDLVVQICELYEQGLDAPRIAAMLNMPVADVGYVINEYFEEMSE
jgi:orotate phosphoribosyltransferase-like protein